jgi:hypothetical protein
MCTRPAPTSGTGRRWGALSEASPSISTAWRSDRARIRQPIEAQALVQMRVAPRMAGDPKLARVFRRHIAETEEQGRVVRGRLEAHSADPSKTKDLIARAGGVGMVLFARSQPDTRG